MARVFVITGPSGVGKGTLIRTLRERMPELELSVSATTRGPRPGEADGVDYHFLSDAEFQRRVDAGDFVEHATYSGRRYGTLRSELDRRTGAGAPVVLEIEVQGARQVRETMPEAIRVFIAPPSREALRTRLVGRGTDDAEQVAARLRTADAELAAQDEFAHVVVNDRLDDAVEELTGIVRAALHERGLSAAVAGAHARAEAGRAGTLDHMINPRIDTLLEHVDSNYASVLVAAKRARQINSYYHNLGEGTFDEFPPPMVESGSKNYLTIALEEVAAGKIKYHYR